MALKRYSLIINSIVLTWWLSQGNVFAAEEIQTSIDYAKVNDLLMVVSERARSKYVYAETKLELKNADILLVDVRMWLTKNDVHVQDIPIDDTGKLDLPIIPITEMEGVELFINQLKNDASLGINFGIRPPENKIVSYRELFIVLEDINDFTGQIAGLGAWFIRDKSTLKFQFEAPTMLTVNALKKTYQYETNKQNVIAVKLKKGLLKENPYVVFSRLPIAVGI